MNFFAASKLQLDGDLIFRFFRHRERVPGHRVTDRPSLDAVRDEAIRAFVEVGGNLIHGGGVTIPMVVFNTVEMTSAPHLVRRKFLCRSVVVFAPTGPQSALNY